MSQKKKKKRPWLKQTQVDECETLVRAWASHDTGWTRLIDGNGITVWSRDWKPDTATWPSLKAGKIFKCHATVDASPQRVYELLLDVAKTPSWNKAVLGTSQPPSHLFSSLHR
jgi:hypothetical protein